jgi:hypothetical protein
MMKRKSGWLSGGLTLLVLLAAALPARASGLEDFKLTRAIPADAMIAVHHRGHAGQEFVNKQYERVWAAVEKQGFDRDLKRMMRGAIQEQEGDVAKFDEQWQKITDLAAKVTWSKLCERESAFALKLGMPTGAEFVLLMMPPADQVAPDFEGLSAILQQIVTLAPEGTFVLSSEGEGETVTHKLSPASQMPPLSLTLARQKDVIVVGFGSGLVEQSLALLGGKGEAGATLASTERFQQAIKRLPPATDGLQFVDVTRVMAQLRTFAQMGAQMMAAMQPTSQPTETPAAGPLDFLPKIVDQLDLWEYLAGVSTTEGMKTTSADIFVLREDAKSRPLFKALYGPGPLRDPLKFIPKEATAVNVNGGVDFAALYNTLLDFVGKEVPEGADHIAQWKRAQEEAGFDVEKDLLSWLGGGYASFTAPRASAYVSEWVLILGVRDEAKANAALTDLAARLDTSLKESNGGVEDAKIEGAEGFKRVILPAFAAMIPGLGRPVFGVKDGHLFVGNSPDIVTLALDVGAGKHENFSKSERFAKEGLPLDANVTGYQFKDLSKLGEELGQVFAITGMLSMMMPPEAQKNPALITLLSMANKLGSVVRTLDFFRSSCTVTTFDGKVSITKGVTNYQEPPKPKVTAPTTQEAPAAEPPAAKPEVEQKPANP